MKALKKLIVPTLIALSCVATADASVIGRLENVGCDVVIDRDGTLYRASEGAGLQAGDRVYSNNGSTANIVLNAGCSGSLNEMQSVSFGPGNSCVDVRNVTAVSTEVQNTIFDGAASCAGGLLVPGAAPSIPAAPSSMSLLAIAGGAALVGLAAGAFDDDDDTPVSP